VISIYFFRSKEKEWAERACQKLSSQLNRFKLLLRILFLNPNDYSKSRTSDEHLVLGQHKTLRFIFTEYGKISTIGGESAFALMVGSLYAKIEDEFGTVITRLCRSFYDNKSHSHSKFRRVCCIPTFLIIVALILTVFGLAIYIRIKNFDLQTVSHN
jgi:ankyrin repeat-rich membrane spanning protein